MSRRSVRIYGGADGTEDSKIASVTSGALHITSPLEVAIGLGQVFTGTTIRSVLLQNDTFDVLIEVGTFPIQWLPIFSVAIETESSLYEGSTFSAAGTSIPLSNRNRESLLTTTTTLSEDPTVTDVGTLIGTILIPQDVVRVTPVPFILKPDTNYIVRMKNVGIADVQVSIQNLLVDEGAA